MYWLQYLSFSSFLLYNADQVILPTSKLLEIKLPGTYLP